MITGYNIDIGDGAEPKFGSRKELTVLNILKCKHCVNKSILLKIVNYCPIGGRFTKRNRKEPFIFLIHVKYF